MAVASGLTPPAPLELLVAQSGCFQIVNRGEGFEALYPERQLPAGGLVGGANNLATLRAANTCFRPRSSIPTSTSVAVAVGSVRCSQVTPASSRRSKRARPCSNAGRSQDGHPASRRDRLSAEEGLFNSQRWHPDECRRRRAGSYTSSDTGEIASLAVLDVLRKLMTRLKAA